MGNGQWGMVKCVVISIAHCLLPIALIAQEPASRSVIVATTTSLNDTGLLDSIAPLFRRATGFTIRVVAVGSGQALKMGERGDADVIMAHSPAAESTFMAQGHGTRRRAFASNYFTLVGPPDDPAGARSAPDMAEALRRIAASRAIFVSRGDSSGTHVREIGLWRRAGGLTRWPGYLETGQGQAPTMLVADERRGYALTDRSTYGTLRRRVELVPLRDAEPALLNIYSVIELNGARLPRVNARGATAFADFLLSDAVQNLLRTYGQSRFGAPLFLPAGR